LFFGLGYSQKDEIIENGNEKKIVPPMAKKIKKELTIHGHTRIDYYYWLNQRENPEVVKHLEAENQYKDAILKPTEGLQKKLYDEIVRRIKKTDMSVPYKYQGYYYYQRYEGEGEYPIYCRKKGDLKNKEEILLNVNEMAKGYDFFYVAGHSVSPDNNMLAYGVDTVSRRKYKIYFKNLKTNEVSKDVLTNTTGRAVWANDNKTVFYSTKDKTLRSYKIFNHVIGTDVSHDREIFHETDPTFSTYVFKSKSRKYIFIGSFHTLSSEYRFIKADNPDDQFKVIQKREKNLEYDVDQYGDYFYIKTNYRAKNFKLIRTPIASPSKENWLDVIPHRDDVLLMNFEIFENFLVLGERKEGLRQLRVKKWDGKGDYYIRFEEEAYMSYISTNPEFETDVLRYGYTSLTTPNSIFDYDMNTRKQKLLKREEVVGEFDPGNYKSERFYVAVRGKTRVPVSLVYKKEMTRNGKNPLLLYGYGSYGASMDPYFSSVRLSLLDRGFIFAIAHIRGGQEMGRQWYDDGKLLKKKNTFYDFIDCAKYLIQEKYTCSDKLFAMGGSAGGLLMGAVVNMEPELFNGIIAGVPWVDVVTTMLDDSIPLTSAEYDEWGDPRQKDYYEYMLSYSPYDNVEAKPYPAMLVTTGLHDSQVQYFEPAKWIQKLREMSTSRNKILLHVNMEAGHGGVSGRFRRHKETAMEYAFMLDLSGINQ
jgi:oligopeptidase B